MNPLPFRAYPSFFSLLIISSALISSVYSPPVRAASDDACAIWMCLPTGFGEGCRGPHKEFRKRTRRHQPAMPPFQACMARPKGDTTEITDRYESKTGVAAYIPSHSVCSNYSSKNGCLDYTTVDEQVIKDEACHRTSKEGDYHPVGCTKTLRYTEVYKNGVLFGQTAYYD
ncbi:hypothetical protein [Aliivibrio fischeri]|uniref:hypothetical protein n=1 Tax=Aliivibrio fischeri TaxID=668 RepID=UPI00084C1F4C|nr:hypothetical protein [Aliivibrio fischeri]OED56699.1 hypothetical protein BEI47_13375 [Aliivibrio fischeri]